VVTRFYASALKRGFLRQLALLSSLVAGTSNFGTIMVKSVASDKSFVDLSELPDDGRAEVFACCWWIQTHFECLPLRKECDPKGLATPTV
jgi:hypothetical protein